MAAADPFVPDDIKRGLKSNVSRLLAGSGPLPSGGYGSPTPSGLARRLGPDYTSLPPSFRNVTGGATGDATTSIDPNGVRMGPPRADGAMPGSATEAYPLLRGAIDTISGRAAPSADFSSARGGVRTNVGLQRRSTVDGALVPPPSSLDETEPLPKGVRRYRSEGYTGTPGTNDIIYEGRGAHGERAFSNNQFSSDLRGGERNPEFDARAGLRSREIATFNARQRQLGEVLAVARATTPQTAKDATDRLTAETNAAKTRAETQNLTGSRGRVMDALDIRTKTNQADLDDQFTVRAKETADAAVKAGVPYPDAVRRGQLAAAQYAASAGLDPADPTLPPDARAGDTGIRQQLANLLNNGQTPGLIGGDVRLPGDRSGIVDDPEQVSAADYEIVPASGLRSGAYLRGPRDQGGGRRTVLLDDAQRDVLEPYLRAARRGLARRREYIADRK